MTTARYVVTCIDPTLPIKERVLWQEETEEAEALVEWAKEQYPDTRISVKDTHSGDVLVFGHRRGHRERGKA